METAAKKKGYPKAFWTCACTEIFERLSYYLGRSLILIFVSATVATGGLGSIIAPETEMIDVYNPNLTLQGMRLIYEKQNRGKK